MEEQRLELRRRLDEVRQRIALYAARSGRKADAVRLMAVTKTVPREAVENAVEAGVDLFGENRVQEAGRKYEGLAGKLELHLIGHLQRNKAGLAAGIFSCVQSIDKLETAQALSGHCSSRGKAMDLLLEVNTSGEESKSGFRTREELLRYLDPIFELPSLRVRGLMTVGPLDQDREAVRRAFSKLSSIFAELAARGLPDFDILSMGMSSDYEIAIEEGSTMVRLGTALFGPRA